MADADASWLRQRVIDAALDLTRTGLSPNMSGNFSARDGGRVF
ncbi:MAG: class II aldolase, partial [Parvibaculum sp.]|nr:class II aldolase [Parvibaculum sp.]